MSYISQDLFIPNALFVTQQRAAILLRIGYSIKLFSRSRNLKCHRLRRSSGTREFHSDSVVRIHVFPLSLTLHHHPNLSSHSDESASRLEDGRITDDCSAELCIQAIGYKCLTLFGDGRPLRLDSVEIKIQRHGLCIPVYVVKIGTFCGLPGTSECNYEN